MCYNSPVKIGSRAPVYGLALVICLLVGACGGSEPAPAATPGSGGPPPAPGIPAPAGSPAAPLSPTPGALVSPTVPPLPTGDPDVLALLPAGSQPLAVTQADLDNDRRAEWIVLAGKAGEPAFETVVPLIIAARPGGYQVVWRGQVDFSVLRSGTLQVLELTGDPYPEILYRNTTPLGGSYAFVYAGGDAVERYRPAPPQGGVCAGLAFFCGWALDLGPPDAGGRRPLISLIDRAGARQFYRWTGSAFAVAETVGGTPWPAGRSTPAPAPRPDPATVDVGAGEAISVIARLETDLDGDGGPEIAIAYQPVGEERLHLAIYSFGGPPGFPESYRQVWSLGPLAGTESQVLRTRELTGDGLPELVSGQGGGETGGGTLYVVGHTAAGYSLLRPQGGPFAGRDSFGAGDYEVQLQSGGKPPLLIAHSGPGAAQAARYLWQNGAFQYQP